MERKLETEEENRERDNSIYFKEGLFGFETCKRFFPVAVEKDSDAVLILQSMEDDNISFVLMNPFILKEDYAPEIPEDELKELGEAEEKDYSWYVLCVARTPAEKSTVNLKCPIVVNTVTHRAKQVILDKREYGFRHTLGELTRREKKIC